MTAKVVMREARMVRGCEAVVNCGQVATVFVDRDDAPPMAVCLDCLHDFGLGGRVLAMVDWSDLARRNVTHSVGCQYRGVDYVVKVDDVTHTTFWAVVPMAGGRSACETRSRDQWTAAHLDAMDLIDRLLTP